MKYALSTLVLLLSNTSLVYAELQSHEEFVKPTRLSLMTSGSDLAAVFADIEKQTGNKLIDETARFGRDEAPSWNFSQSDREFWPLVDRFLDAASLEPLSNISTEGLPIGWRMNGIGPRYGKAVYVGPFRLEVSRIASHLNPRHFDERRATIDLEIAWEPRLRPLVFTQPVRGLKLVADDETAVKVAEGSRELTVEAAAGSYAVTLTMPLELPPRQLSVISSLKGRIACLVATRNAEFRFADLAKAANTEQTHDGVKVVLERVRQNQDLCELHMRLEFDENLPEFIAQGSWNFQNTTYLENAAGEKIEHAGFEMTTQSKRKLSLAYYFDVPADKLAEYSWVYHAPTGIVEVPIEFEMKNVPLP